MINETAFIGCRNCLPEMAKNFDRPWNFVGEVKVNGNYLNVVCMKCMPPVSLVVDSDPAPSYMRIVSMRGHWFITDDMLKVKVFFGTCECGAVYWARQGPPFRRCRAYSSVSS